MVERCLNAASDIAQMQVLNHAAVESAVEQMGNPENTRLIVTNSSSQIIYDSVAHNAEGAYAILPEILQALGGNKVFSCNYYDSTIVSRCAVPIYSYGTLTGVFYMMEPDPEQGLLIATLERNILSVSLGE